MTGSLLYVACIVVITVIALTVNAYVIAYLWEVAELIHRAEIERQTDEGKDGRQGSNEGTDVVTGDTED